MSKRKVIFLVGPTAVGKTSVSLEIARQLDGEIISADSRQIYRGLDIGTAKPSPESLMEIKHWFINELDPNEDFSAGQFGELGREKVDDIIARGKTPIVVGGSGLYIRAMIDGFFSGDVKNDKVREALRKRMEDEGAEDLYDDLQKIDPEGAAKIHPNDSQRILRLMEVYLITGKPLNELQKKNIPPANFEALYYGLIIDRDELYNRINDRVDRMVEDGLLAEVANLRVEGYLPSLNSLNTVGYKEFFQYFNGELSFDETIENIKMNSRRYAKRQITWFKADDRIKWIDVSTEKARTDLINMIISDYRG
jgi:tRNA dimethylallyltransferase